MNSFEKLLKICQSLKTKFYIFLSFCLHLLKKPRTKEIRKSLEKVEMGDSLVHFIDFKNPPRLRWIKECLKAYKISNLTNFSAISRNSFELDFNFDKCILKACQFSLFRKNRWNFNWRLMGFTLLYPFHNRNTNVINLRPRYRTQCNERLYDSPWASSNRDNEHKRNASASISSIDTAWNAG